MTYREKLVALEAGTLPAVGFSHLDHIGVGFEAIQSYGIFDALSRVARGLEDLACRAGVPEKFNATITFAAMSLIAEKMQGGAFSDGEAFVSCHGAELSGAFLTRQYEQTRLQSNLARAVPLLPGDQFGTGMN